MIDRTVFKRAADVIRTRGWNQGDFEDSHGCVCTLGALNLTLFNAARLGDVVTKSNLSYAEMYDEREPYAIQIRNGLGITGDGWMGTIADWNDKRGRTEQEVIDLFERLAAS